MFVSHSSQLTMANPIFKAKHTILCIKRTSITLYATDNLESFCAAYIGSDTPANEAAELRGVGAAYWVGETCWMQIPPIPAP